MQLAKGLAELRGFLRAGAAEAARQAAALGAKAAAPRHRCVSFPGWKHAMAIEHAERMADEMASFWRDEGVAPHGAGEANKKKKERPPTVVVGEGNGRVRALIPNAARKPAAIFALAARNTRRR